MASNNFRMDNQWLPFTPNRYFKQHPKVVVGAQGAYYQTSDGRQLFDALSGLWCCPLGHGHPKIVEALATQAATLDYAPAFQLAHPGSLKLAGRIADLAPAGRELDWQPAYSLADALAHFAPYCVSAS